MQRIESVVSLESVVESRWSHRRSGGKGSKTFGGKRCRGIGGGACRVRGRVCVGKSSQSEGFEEN
jgi:hypothetical protein